MALTNALRGGIKPGGADLSLEITLHNSSTGAPETGVAHTSVTAYYYRQGAASATQITMASLAAANSTHSDGGWKELDATNYKGRYRFDVPDNFWTTGADWVGLDIVVANCDEVKLWYPLDVLSVDSSGRTLLQPTQTGVTIPTVTTLTGHTAQTGDGYAILNHADYGNAQLVRSVTPANALAVDSNNAAAVTGTSITLSSAERQAVADALFARSLPTESYAALGAIPTFAQAVYQLLSMWFHTTSGTTVTFKKLNMSDASETATLSPDAANPTSILRAS